MNYFLIRHKESGEFMPEYKYGRGYSYWRYDNIMDNQHKYPRLIESRAKAQKVIVEWAKGVLVWHRIPRPQPILNLPDPGPYYFELENEVRKIRPLNRTKDMLEVVEVELKEIV